MSCDELKKALLAYVDGELDASHVLTVETHLAVCNACTEHVALSRAMKRALRTTSQTDTAPPSLRARIARSAAAASSPASPASDVIPFDRPRVAPSWRSALPWAAAAALAIGIGGGVRALGDGGGSGTNARTRAAVASMNPTQGSHIAILDDFAEHHARPLPPEEIDPVRISSVFSPIVGVPVRPVRFAAPRGGGAYRFAGARMMTVHDEAAATLFYDMSGTRVAVFVFDPNRISIRSSCCLSPKIVKIHDEERTVYVGRSKGYSLAVQERDGVGYAVSADLGEQDVMAIAAGLPSP